MNVLISIGNSDDKLSQREWSHFIDEVRERLDRQIGLLIHGEWFSAPDSPYQNANWCIEFIGGDDTYLKQRLVEIRKKYRQDSIAWTEGHVEFI